MAGKRIQRNRGKEIPKLVVKSPAPNSSPILSSPYNLAANKTVKQSTPTRADLGRPPPDRARASKFPEKRLNPFAAAKTIRDVAGEEDTMPAPASSGLRNFLQQTSKAITAAEEDSERQVEDRNSVVPDENRPYKFTRISFSCKKFPQNRKMFAPKELAAKKQATVQIIDTRKNQAEKKTSG